MKRLLVRLCYVAGVLRRAFVRWQAARDDRVLHRLRTEQANIHNDHRLLRLCFGAWKQHQQTAVRKAVSVAMHGAC